jgi:hypothetical protein
MTDLNRVESHVVHDACTERSATENDDVRIKIRRQTLRSGNIERASFSHWLQKMKVPERSIKHFALWLLLIAVEIESMDVGAFELLPM